jgi:TatD DNase family protein
LSGVLGDHYLVDTHSHLDAAEFAAEPTAALLARAAVEGIARVVTVGLDVATSRQAVALAGDHEAVWAAVGAAPNDLDGFDEGALDDLRTLVRQPRVVAIGEIGLDYHWHRFPPNLQQTAFQQQLALAREVDLPVIIHSRDADEDTAAILLTWAETTRRGGRPLGVMHCFAGDVALAQRLIEAGFMISLSGVVTFKNASRAHAVASELPMDHLVLETDAPYLSPEPYRGPQHRNEPSRLRLVAAQVAALRGVSLAEIASATSANAVRLFGWEAV